MDYKKLDTTIASFVKKKEEIPVHFNEDLQERLDRRSYYSSFDAETIRAMDRDELSEYLSKLWAMMMWGDKQKHAEKLIDDNGTDSLKTSLAEVLYGDKPLITRWNTFMESVKGIGPATVSELLTYVDPHEYAIMNRITISCLGYLGADGMPKYNYQQTCEKYLEICEISKEISAKLQEAGIEDADLLTVDYFMWDEVLPFVEAKDEQPSAGQRKETNLSSSESKSFHNELRDKIVAIGELLGFESRSEVKIASGAVVDAIWEAKIGNMGKAIYVFEVQSKGSIDSLILNLKKAQSNAAVQAVVAVSDEDQLEKILVESKGVIDANSLRTWESSDVMDVYDSLVRAHESINKLSLVPESF